MMESAAQESNTGTETVKHIPLSSRQRLCINPSVSRLGSLSAINDRCAELQQPKTKEKCAFVPNADNLSNTHRFRDTALATLPDIEDMFQIGKTLQVCPYYASRTAIPGAEVITLPYPLLLQKSARDALGIKLEGNVVIIDEAHNIMDAVSNVYAAEIRLGELRKARQALGVYVKRFGKKLKGENRVMVAQVGRVVDSLSEWLDGAMKAKVGKPSDLQYLRADIQIKAAQGITDPNLLLKGKGADQLNLYKLIQYIQESKLAYKVESYAAYIEEDGSSDHQPSSTPVLHNLLSFLMALTNLSTEGRIFFEKLPSSPPDIKLSYLLLSPTHAFSSIASSARAVILAGGTMSPFDDYKAHLFPSLPAEKITTLSCGHVIPPSNLCVWNLASTRPGVAAAANTETFEFTFQKRRDKAMIRQLGRVLLNISSVVPDGVVVFFPSYGYLDEVVGVWQSSDPANDSSAPCLWDRLQSKKAVFRESKGGSSDEVLQQYTAAILGDETQPGKSNPRGALLLSVVGGKMSEGINFSDRLGRCVVVVGLPYPNRNSPEWKARIEYIQSSTLARLTDGSVAGSTPAISREEAIAASKQAAMDFYENGCMRAVNQSIGRAIRHQNDYAAIVLLDRRFGIERIRTKLPGWIRGGMVAGSEEKGMQGLMGALNSFFRSKKNQQ
jgi:chromosome transmission fidelity protein 1